MPRDVWIGAVVLGAAALYWLAADQIPVSPLDGPVGAQGLPKSLAYALGALALLLIARALLVERRPGRPAPADDGGGWAEARRRHLRAAGMLALGVGYLLVVPWLGYAVSLFLLMLAVAVYVGAPPRPTLLGIAALGAAFFYLLFVRFLDIPLPPGFWPTLVG